MRLAAAPSLALLTGFSLILIVATVLLSRRKYSIDLFLVANRQLGLVIGAISSIAAWTWAPALFVSSQVAYAQGLPGAFWFTVPNALALILFAILAGRLRRLMDHGYTLPEFVGRRLGQRSRSVHVVAILVVQCYAVIVQLTGALLLLNLLTGVSKFVLVPITGALFLIVAGLRGIRSSVVSDVIKGLMLAAVGLVVIPWLLVNAGGIGTVIGGLGGASGRFTNLFDPLVAWTYGVPISVSLLSGVVIDQQQWQRAFAIRKGNVRMAFVLAGILFALIPSMLSLLGFVSADRASGVHVPQPQLSGVAAVAHFLPTVGIIVFALMVLAALISAGGAALCALSSIAVVDVYATLGGSLTNEQRMLRIARIAMLLVLLLAMAIALLPNVQILYIQLLVGSFRAALLVPTVLALFWRRLSSTAAFYGMLAGIAVGVPVFIAGSLVNNLALSSVGSLLPIAISALICLVGTYVKPERFEFATLAQESKFATVAERRVASSA